VGILSASTGLTRYRAVEEVGDEVLMDVPRRLKSFAFVDIDHGLEERSFGWVCIDDLLDAEWHTAGPEKGPYLAFSLRLDTRRISPAVFKKHWLLALKQTQKELAEQGRKFLTRDQKIKLREHVRQRLLARSLPIPAVFDVAWNTRDNRVYLATTNSKIRTLFEDIFARTFETALEPLTPVTLALDQLGEGVRHRLNEFEGAVFAPGRETTQ